MALEQQETAADPNGKNGANSMVFLVRLALTQHKEYRGEQSRRRKEIRVSWRIGAGLY